MICSVRIVALWLLFSAKASFGYSSTDEILDQLADGMNLDEYFSSAFKGDFLNSLKLPKIDLTSGSSVYGSGEFSLFENDTEEMGNQLIMDMIFRSHLFESNITDKTDLWTKWLLNGGNKWIESMIYDSTKDRLRKSNYPEDDEDVYYNDKMKPYSDIIGQINEILRKNRNATFSVVNGQIIMEESMEDDKNQEKIIKICSIPIESFSDIENITENMTMDTKNKLKNLFQDYFSGNISGDEFRATLMKTGLFDNGTMCDNGISTTTAILPTTISMRNVEIAQIRMIVDEGYLDETVIRDVGEGKTTMEEVRVKLMRNRTFVLSRFPPKIEEMLKADRIPDEMVVVMFSGNMTMEELRIYIYQNDDISKALLPERLRDILETRLPPQELKDILLDADNASHVMIQVMSNETLLQEMMSESMYYFYTLFKVPRNVALNMALSGTTIVALCSVMTSLGCTMTVTEIMKHVKRPKGVIIALISQYGIMPLGAFALTRAFNLDVYPAIAVLICGCCPGGNLSNMLAFAINGDMNLSILMTTCSSVLGLGMMPFLLFCYSRYIIPIDSSEIVPFDKIILNVALTIVPVSVGIAIKHYRPKWTVHVMRFGAVMLVICSITFAILAGLLLGDKFFYFFPTEVVYCAAILPMTGYIFGFCFARLFRENQKSCRTICVETGCQNVQLCGTVLKLAFDPILVGVMILLPIIYMAFQAFEALLLITLYRIYQRFCGKKNSETPDIEFEDEEKQLERSDSENSVNEKTSLKNEKELAEESDEDKDSKEPCTNGIKKTEDSRNDEEINETWPLVSTPEENLLEALKKADKENVV
ncbi:uncharacterized protein LOC120342401 [Styela clava]